MTTNLMLTGALALTMVGTGCATKKYVAKTMAPVEARVATAETKNADQDKMLTAQGQELEQLQTSLSRTNERVADADGKAVAAGTAAQRAADAAAGAQRTADGAKTDAAGAMTAANGATARANEVEKTLSAKVDQTIRFTKAGEETVLFAVNQATLSKDAMAALDSFAEQVSGKDRFVIEIQGFTDKTGSAELNTALSQRRAEVVARYLVNEHDIPLHMVTMMGSGYTDPVADDKTRDGRKQNRRVEVRVYAPEVNSLTASN